MNDILIKIETKTAKAYCENNRIGVQHANLQNKLIFEMSEKINGSAWLEYEINGVKNYAVMEDTEKGYQIDIKSCLLISSNVNVDLKITESENVEGIPIFVSTIVELDVYESINATEEEPEYYPDWKTVADSKIAEMNQLKEDVNEAITETNNLDIDISKSGKIATVELTKKDATAKTVTLSDGTSLMFNWDETRLGIKTDEEQEYTYVDLQGVQGPIGPQGEAFQIKKTYSSITAMNADFNNMSLGDYVMIASEVEQEDNAKLYTRGESQWIFISDFSGAQGIKGETGATPNIQIGTVVTGDHSAVTRTGTNENPVLNFVLEKGEQGIQGIQGETGATGNGIASIEKTGTSGNIDTYTITYTNGNTSTFTVTNSTVTNQEFNNLKNKYDTLVNTLPKITGSGINITLNNVAEYYTEIELEPSLIAEDGSQSVENPIDVNTTKGDNTILIEGKNLFDKNNANILNAYIDRTTTTITSINNNKIIWIPCRPNTTYTITRMSGFQPNVAWTEETPALGITSYGQVKAENNVATITTGETAQYLIVRVYQETGDTESVNTILDSLQIEYGDTSTPYEPYQSPSQNFSIDLGDYEYCKLDDSKDKIYRDNNGNWYFEENVRKRVLDGAHEDWIYSSYSNDTIYATFARLSGKNLSKYYTNKFKYLTVVNSYTTVEYSGTNGDAMRLGILKSRLSETSIVGLKSWLSQNNIKVYYERNTSLTTDITNTTLGQELENLYQNAKTYQGTTHISQINDGLPFNIKISALYNLNNLINRLETLEGEEE